MKFLKKKIIIKNMLKLFPLLLALNINAQLITNSQSQCLSNSAGIDYIISGRDISDTNNVYCNFIGFHFGTNYAKSISPSLNNPPPITNYFSTNYNYKLWAEDDGTNVRVQEIKKTILFVSNVSNKTNTFQVSRDGSNWNTYILPKTGFRPIMESNLVFRRRNY